MAHVSIASAEASLHLVFKHHLLCSQRFFEHA